MSGPSVEKVDNEPFEFETVKFIAGPADHPECKRAKCLDALERAKDAVKDYLEARGANYIANLIVRDAALARVARTGTAEAVQTAIAGLRLSEFLVLAGEVGLGFAAFGIGFCIGSIFT